MAITSKKKSLEYPLLDVPEDQDSILARNLTSEDQLVSSIVKLFPLRRQRIAGNQIKIYLKKKDAHPEMGTFLISKIKQLILYEKKLMEKKVEYHE
jgi:hypothetical protein